MIVDICHVGVGAGDGNGGGGTGSELKMPARNHNFDPQLIDAQSTKNGNNEKS